MPSPFPGMDPYLEAHWRDVHARLIVYACDALQPALPDPLRARVEESVLLLPLQGLGELPRLGHACAGPDVALSGPILIDTEAEPATETFIEIIDRSSGHRVVTVIEFLSPSNKSPGPNREQYQRKQREVCDSDANLVEIDLNRFGTHTLAFPLIHVKPAGRTPYMACVRRAARRGKAEVYPMPLWERLPVLKVPPRPTDADVPLGLQALVEQCYRNGAYEATVDYSAEPDPPLVGDAAEWADQMLREKGLRTGPKPARREAKKRPKKR